MIMVLIYVDDIIVTSNNTHRLNQFIEKLHAVFALKDLGALHYFLGIEVHRDQTGIYLNQGKYVKELLHRTGMMHLKPCSMPMAIGRPLSKSNGEPLQNPTDYKSIIGGL